MPKNDACQKDIMKQVHTQEPPTLGATVKIQSPGRTGPRDICTPAFWCYKRGIQKISSVYEYGRCSAAVTMVRKRAEFLDSLLSHGRNLQTSEQCLLIVLCVYNV